MKIKTFTRFLCHVLEEDTIGIFKSFTQIHLLNPLYSNLLFNLLLELLHRFNDNVVWFIRILSPRLDLQIKAPEQEFGSICISNRRIHFNTIPAMCTCTNNLHRYTKIETDRHIQTDSVKDTHAQTYVLTRTDRQSEKETHTNMRTHQNVHTHARMWIPEVQSRRGSSSANRMFALLTQPRSYLNILAIHTQQSLIEYTERNTERLYLII